MTFADLLAYKKITVYSLSKLSGIAKTTINDIASGKTNILDCSGKTLSALSNALNISVDKLLSLEEEEAKTTLPLFLNDSIKEYRKAIRTDSTLIDCYNDQLRSSINAAEVENMISKERANMDRQQ